MYFAQFGLNRPPFEETASPKFFCETPGRVRIIAEVLDQLRHPGLVLVTGENGVGKSILGRVLLRRLRDDACTLSVAPSPDDANHVLDQLSAAFHLDSPTSAAAAGCIAQIVASLGSQPFDRCVVLIDQAEHLGVDDLLALDDLVRMAADSGVTMGVALLGTPAVADMLQHPTLRELAGRIHRTTPLIEIQPDELGDYLATRLQAAGDRSALHCFHASAITQINTLTGGWPRRINELAKRALMTAAAQQRTDIDAPLIARCFQEIETVEPSLDHHTNPNPAPQTAQAPAPGDVERFASLIERFERLMEAAPQRLREFESGLDRLQTRADQVVRDAAERVTTVEQTCRLATETEAVIAERLPQLESATHDAVEIQQQLASYAQRITEVGQASEDRISLLLTGLDTAQEIQDKLDTVGQEVTDLIADSRKATGQEREALQNLFDELSSRRAEASAMIDSLRREQQAALERHEQMVSDAIACGRREMEEACGLSAEALTQARTVTDEFRTDMAGMIAATRRDTEAAAAAGADLCDRLNQTEQAVAQQIAAASKQLADHDERIERMARERRLSETATEQAIAAAVALARENDHAEGLKTTCIATVERLQADGVAAIEETATRFQDQLADAINRFDGLVATERAARDGAEKAVRAAQTAVATVQDAERKLADAQAAAINIEATASAALSSVQQQIKRFQDSVDVVVKYGVDKTKNEVNELIDECQAKASQAAATLSQAVDAAVERVTGEIAAMVETATAQQNHLREELTECGARVSNEIDELAARLRANALGQIEAASTEIENLRTQAETGVGEIFSRMMSESTAAAESLAQQIENGQADIRTIARQQVEAAAESIAEALAHGQNALNSDIDAALGTLRSCATSSREHFSSTAANLQAQFNQQTDEALAHMANARQDLEKRLGAIEKELNQGTASAVTRIETAGRQSVERIKAETQQRFSHAAERIEAAGRQGVELIKAETQQRSSHAAETLVNLAQREHHRLQEHATQSAADATGMIRSATDEAAALHKNLAAEVIAAEKALAEARTTREQIDHQIRDVWSLTSTTDERVRMLAALNDHADTKETQITRLLGDAAKLRDALSAQMAHAAKSAETLAQQQTQVKTVCATFAAKIEEAQRVNTALVAAHREGADLSPQMQSRIDETRELLASAGHLVADIRAEAETAAATSHAVQELLGATGTLETRVAELQEALAQPISLIQDAQAQAEELNAICLAVKRVFRGISQASLQANERIKILGKMLAATDNVKQWVEEAKHAQQRLAETLQQTPSIAETHPLIALPSATGTPISAVVRDAGMRADDRATINRLAQDRPGHAKPAANVSAHPKPLAAKVPAAGASVARTVEPLVDVLKNRHGGGSGVIPAQGRDGTLGRKLRPEDVEAMIREARAESNAR